MTPLLLLLADDLTGAADTAAPFARSGIATALLLADESGRVLHEPADTAVVAVDTETRHCVPPRAAARVRSVVEAAFARGTGLFFKKTDSTMRGNVGAELGALLHALSRDAIAFVPAFPQAGRTTRGGVHLVDGVELHRSQFGRDPRNPVSRSDIAGLLRTQCDLPVTIATAPIREEIAREGWRGVCVFDAEQPGDLDEIAAALARHGRMGCCAGSAGFAAALAQHLPLPPGAPPALRIPPAPIVIVNGSLTKTALAQLDEALAGGWGAVPLAPERCIDADAAVRAALAAPPCAADAPGYVVYTARRSEEASGWLEAARTRGLDTAASCAAIDRCVAAAGAAISRARGAQVLALFGGDTSRAALAALGDPSLRIVDEIAPGVVASEIASADAPRVVITKSGGFGGRNVADAIRTWVKRHEG